MKKVMIFGVVLLFPALALAENAPVQNPVSQNPVVVQESSGVFKGALLKVWTKFRTMSPKDTKEVKQVSVTAGIRGAETTSTILQPYWKDDRSGDEQYVKQLEQFAAAQDLIEKGQMEAAGKAFSDFMTSWPQSDLKPNAQFALGLAYGGMARKDQSVQAFNQFIKDYPKHPLVADAREAVAALQ